MLKRIIRKAIVRRNYRFDNNIYRTYKCGVPVISVGNLTFGGTGKTPFTILLANILKEKGALPAVVAKGYKRKSKEEAIVSNGTYIENDVEKCGDEPILIAKKTGVPVIVNRKKYIGALNAEEYFKPDCIIIDDGFQHRLLQRDADIALVDKATVTDNDIMPYGTLREPLDSLDRADLIVLTEDFKIKNKTLEKYLSMKPSLKIRFTLTSPYNLKTREEFNVNALSDKEKKIFYFSGIANPEKFEKQLDEFGLEVADHQRYPDHRYYKTKDIRRILKTMNKRDLSIAAVTEKDSVKLRDFGEIFAKENKKVIVFPLEAHIAEGEDNLYELISKTIR